MKIAIEHLEGEEWRPVPGHEGLYAVSSMGRVCGLPRRVKSKGGSLHGVRQRLLRFGRRGRSEYKTVVLSKNGKSTKFAVNRLVLFAFVGVRGSDTHGCHINGDKTDNRLSNLRWGTPVDNGRDQYAHGTRVQGESSGTSKLAAADVLDIRRRLAAGERGSALAREYGVLKACISAIKARRTWKHLADNDKEA